MKEIVRAFNRDKCCHLAFCVLYYKHIMIVNDTSRVVRMMPQLGASLTIVILTTLEVSFMLLELSFMLLKNIYSTGITQDDSHLQFLYRPLIKVNSSSICFIQLSFKPKHVLLVLCPNTHYCQLWACTIKHFYT